MGLVSGPSHVPREIEVSVGVLDCFEIKETYGLDHAPGVVVVLDAFPLENLQALVGENARVLVSGQPARVARIADARDHGPTISVFFEGLTKGDVLVGATLEFLCHSA